MIIMAPYVEPPFLWQWSYIWIRLKYDEIRLGLYNKQMKLLLPPYIENPSPFINCRYVSTKKLSDMISTISKAISIQTI